MYVSVLYNRWYIMDQQFSNFLVSGPLHTIKNYRRVKELLYMWAFSVIFTALEIKIYWLFITYNNGKLIT